MFRMNAAQIDKQLDDSQTLFEKVFGSRTWLFRPPWGSHSPLVDALVAKRGYTVVLWNLCVADWVERPVRQMLTTWRQVLKKVEEVKGSRGGVVLLHDTHAWTVEALRLVYDDIQSRNCELLAGGQELYDIVDTLDPFFSTRAVHDPSQRAPAAEPNPAFLQTRQTLLREKTAARCRARPP
jgi:peptidoglycan/xylan/chitin deacetylase (PgdA/CDA1 family)